MSKPISKKSKTKDEKPERKHLENYIKLGNIDDLPLTLSVEDVGKILKMCKAKAYELVYSQVFKYLRIGKRVVVPTKPFLAWLNDDRGGSLI